MARGCLFDNTENDLKTIVRNGDRAALEAALREIVGRKSGKGLLSSADSCRKLFDMSKVGE